MTTLELIVRTGFRVGNRRRRWQQHLIDLDIERSESTELGWKHAGPDLGLIRHLDDPGQYFFVCVVKSPYAYIESLHRRPYQDLLPRRTSLDEFVNSPWDTVGRDNLDGRSLRSPVELWNLKVASYHELAASVPNCMISRYEDIVADLSGFFDKLDAFLSMTASRINIETSTKGDDEMDFASYAAKYTHYDPGKLGASVIDSINHFLDHDLVKRAGYGIYAG
ncbi:MAG: sulfotransferase [Actinomycetia bacterium]|nr:sulfotransferase [Actinomycetes bacterium]MCP5031071.1 sulfotransferase [Actinomycetes bacterium]